MNYGLPYMGSKNRIARWVVNNMPTADTLIDAFAGGCAVTHAALLSGKFRRIVANDVDDAPRLFLDAVRGRFRKENRWISRQDYDALRDSDPYVRYCWSFGNRGGSYIYGRQIEPYKRACHFAIVFDEWAQLRELCPEVSGAAESALAGLKDRKARRRAFGPAIVRELKSLANPTLWKNPLYASCKKSPKGDLKSLESLESLERLESLESLESLASLASDYRSLSIPPNSVVYCDPPYENTECYRSGAFDHGAFREWLSALPVPFLVSEYNMPEPFIEVASVQKQTNLCATKSSVVTERLYTLPKWRDRIGLEATLDLWVAASRANGRDAG